MTEPEATTAPKRDRSVGSEILHRQIERLEAFGTSHPNNRLSRFFLELASIANQMSQLMVEGPGATLDNILSLNTRKILTELLSEEGLTAKDSFSAQLSAISEVSQTVSDYLRAAHASLMEQPKVVAGLPTDRLDRLQRLVDRANLLSMDVEQSIARTSVEFISQSAKQAQESLGALRQATQQTAEVRLGDSFQRYADGETRQAWVMRGVALLLFTISSSVGYELAAQFDGRDVAVSELVRLAVVFPLIAFAYYFVREASHHRDAAQRAKENLVRLETIAAFSDGMTPESQDRLRSNFGDRVFNEKVTSPPETGTESPFEVKDVSEIIKAVAEVLRQARP